MIFYGIIHKCVVLRIVLALIGKCCIAQYSSVMAALSVIPFLHFIQLSLIGTL